jgi:hypothetical protein
LAGEPLRTVLFAVAARIRAGAASPAPTPPAARRKVRRETVSLGQSLGVEIMAIPPIFL